MKKKKPYGWLPPGVPRKVEQILYDSGLKLGDVARVNNGRYYKVIGLDKNGVKLELQR